MADTLKFGPEWLRQLSDGNSVASPPPTPGLGSKFKIAEYRYGREEMLALFHNNYKAPDDLVNYPPVYVEDSQKPLALISLTEEEQRLMSQSVNSTTVLRSMGRGGPPVRGGRGGGDRGRGRGRGRGDGFPPRGGTFDPAENGGFGRSRGQNKDGWEEVGKKYDRSYSNRNHEEGPRHPQFSRSLSSDNWREKDEQIQDDEGGDWRRAGPQKERWGTRSNWREPLGRGGFDGERRPNGPIKDRTRSDADDKHHVYRRSRSSESWDTDDLPEWSVPGDDDMEELGTFDASGAFVTSHPKVMRNGDSPSSDSPSSQPQTDQGKEPPREQRKDKKLPRPMSAPDIKQSASNHGNSHSNSPQTVKNGQDHNRNDPSKSVQFGDVSQIANNSNSVPMEKKVDANSTSQDSNLPKVKKVKNTVPVAESEALSRLREAAENMVAEMTAEEDEHKSSVPIEPHGQGVPLNHEDSMKWFYKDPQGKVQGPFNPEEMAQWFSAGYFTMSLLVKRGCDERFQQLGELIKRWGRVPFLAGPSPPPLMNNPAPCANTEPPVKPAPPPPQQQPTPPPQDLMGIIPQQFLLQQLMQQQMLMRSMQVQMMAQLQEQESFTSLSPPQQQQLVMQMLMQTQPVFMQQMQQLQQLQQQQQQQQPQNRLSPQPQSEGAPPASHQAYSRSVSQPVPAEAEVPPPGTQGNWSQPTSVWDLEGTGTDMPPNSINQQHLEKLQAHQKAEEARRKLEEEERRQQNEIQQKQEELKRQQEEIAREREKMLREKEELDRQRQMEMKRVEDIRRLEEEERRRQIEEELKQEEERRREDKRRQDEELAAQREEEARRQQQEERRRAEEEQRRREELQKKQIEEEHRRQELLRQQDLQRQQEEMKLQQQREEEEQREMLRQQELQRQEQQRQQQQRQQQEALRKLQEQQREQLARMCQLPPTAQWANQSPQRDAGEGKSLAEIQQEEERQSQERERQLEFQRQQMMALQQQQQQQQQQLQKSWGTQMTVNQTATNTLKSLLDIQEEQAKQTDQNKKKTKPVQQTQAKVSPAATLTTPSMWSNVASNGAQSSGWGGNAVWGTDKSAGGTGFWDEPVIPPRKAATKDSGEFPALGGKKRNQQMNNNSTSSASTAANRMKQAKPKKEEDVVQKLFQRPVDDFTQWCEKALAGLASSVDVPTFIAFLQEVESPYEVHDYVKMYLGESAAAKEFGRQFLEKRSQYKQKARLERQQEEDSIWGPAPAVNPKEARSSNNNDFESVSARNKNKKKKGKMQKVDKSILGFTVLADPTRVNAGEIDNVD